MSPVQDFIMEELADYGDARVLYIQPWRTPGFPLDSLDILALIQEVEDGFSPGPLTAEVIDTLDSFASLAEYIEAAHEQ